MPITVVQQAMDARLNGNAPSAVLPAAPVAGTGRYLVAYLHSSSAGALPNTATASHVFTELAKVDDAGRYTGFWIRKIQAGDAATVTFSLDYTPPGTTELSELCVFEVAGLDEAGITTPHDWQGGVAGSYTSIQAGAVDVTATAGAIVFGAAGLGGITGGQEAITGTGASGGFSSPTAISAVLERSVLGYKIFTGAASGINPTFSWNTANPRRANALQVALKAAVPVTSTGYTVAVKDAGTTWKNYEIHRCS